MAKKNVLVVVASQGYQPVEYGDTRNVLIDAGFVVTTASDKSGIAHATDGSQTDVDITLDDADMNDYDGIFFIGGSGALTYLDNPKSYALATKAAQLGKAFGAICISTRILAKAGVLKGRKVTGWNGDDKLPGVLQEHDVVYEQGDVVIDGNIVTANGPTVAQNFAQAIVSVLP